MKRILSLLVILAAVASTMASDAYYFGAWWDTHCDKLDVPVKRAGTALFTFSSDGSFKLVRFTGLTNYYEYKGEWAEFGNKRFFDTTNTDLKTRWSGTFDDLQLSGSFKNENESGRFEAIHQTNPF